MKKFKFGTLVCYALVLAMIVPFGSMAASDSEFIAPEYKSYSAGGESSLEIELDYVPYEWLSINVIDNATGEIWESNPVRSNATSASQSSERNKTENSQIILEYSYDENGNQEQLADVGYVSSSNKLGTFYSYDDCVIRDQVEIIPLDVNGNEMGQDVIDAIKAGEALSDDVKAQIKGYKIVYGLGQINSEVLPAAMLAEDLDFWVSKLVDENGNPDEKSQAELRKNYQSVTLAKLEEEFERNYNRAKKEDKKKLEEEYQEKVDTYLLNYPILSEGAEVYVLYTNATNTEKKKERIISFWAAAGLTREDMEACYETIGYEGSGSDVEFYIPVVYMIEGNTFKVEIVTEEIGISPEVGITRLHLLPHFASKTDNSVEEGYTLLPDGSGAIVEHGSGDTRSTSVQIVIGDRHKDEGLSRTGNNISAIPYFEQSILPVFGMKQDNRAVFAVIEEGYELVNVAMNLAEGAQNQYNYTYASFYPTETDEIYYSDGSQSGLTMFPKYTVPTEVEIKVGKKAGTTEIQDWNYCRLPDTSLQVRFVFLYDEEANYTGMANYFRQYLIDMYGMEKLEASENTTFYADIYGAIQKKVSFAGFPIEKKYALTDFEEAEIIVDTLLENVSELSVRYMGMANGSLYSTDYSDHFKPLYVLGGKSGYTEFLASMESKGVSVYPDVNPTHVYVDKTFDGFMPYFDAVKTLGKQTNIIQNHNLATGLYGEATGEADDGYYFPRWVVSPVLYEETFAGLMEDLEVYGNRNISMAQVGSTLSADYDETLIIDRTQTSRILSALLEEYEDAGYSTSVEVGNYWTLPYVDVIMKIPTTSSKYLIEDYEVPFVQMAIHGLIDYTGEEINTVQDAQYQILKCLEYGCSLSARLMYEDDIVLQNTYYTTLLYSLNYQSWIGQISEMYTTVNDIMKDVQDQYIVAHERLATNVFVTTYENGLTIAVNYNNEDVVTSYGGAEVSIEANGFVVLDKGD